MSDDEKKRFFELAQKDAEVVFTSSLKSYNYVLFLEIPSRSRSLWRRRVDEKEKESKERSKCPKKSFVSLIIVFAFLFKYKTALLQKLYLKFYVN